MEGGEIMVDLNATVVEGTGANQYPVTPKGVIIKFLEGFPTVNLGSAAGIEMIADRIVADLQKNGLLTVKRQ